jgi:hypothetical protein
MADLDDSYDGLAGFAKLAQVAKDFDFGRSLPAATFPASFVQFYVVLAHGEPVDWDADKRYFLATFDDHVEICMYEGLFSPQMIQSQNALIAESIYAEAGSLIMPPGYYAIGSAYNDLGEMRLMVNLQADQPDYGKIFIWNLAWDPLGTGDNTRGIGLVAAELQAFYANLQPKDAL